MVKQEIQYPIKYASLKKLTYVIDSVNSTDYFIVTIDLHRHFVNKDSCSYLEKKYGLTLVDTKVDFYDIWAVLYCGNIIKNYFGSKHMVTIKFNIGLWLDCIIFCNKNLDKFDSLISEHTIISEIDNTYLSYDNRKIWSGNKDLHNISFLLFKSIPTELNPVIGRYIIDNFHSSFVYDACIKRTKKAH